LLEWDLDNALEVARQNLEKLAPRDIPHFSFEAIARARSYRAAHPFKSANAYIQGEVDSALKMQAPPDANAGVR
jgi:hypothetical protein